MFLETGHSFSGYVCFKNMDGRNLLILELYILVVFLSLIYRKVHKHTLMSL